MNILYIGQYRGNINDGWSCVSREYLESLLLTKHNIVSKPIYMASNSINHISDRILEAEKKQFDQHPDIIIQHVIPELMEWHKGYNIGLFDTETWKIDNSPWIDKINLMDEIWVDSLYEKQNLLDSGVTKKIQVVPVPANTKYLTQFLNIEPIQDIIEIKNKFIFYFIGEHSERKNILAFVKAFHREFEPEENVAIVIKSNSEKLKEDINEWKKTSRTRRNFIPEILILGNIPEKDIYRLHKTCNCFVCTSRGESMCIPIVDALYFNNEVLCTDGIFASSLYEDHIIRVDSTTIPVDCKNPPIPSIYTGSELWNEINILDLQRKMRKLFNSQDKIKKNHNEFIEEKFSRRAISEKMKEILNKHLPCQ